MRYFAVVIAIMTAVLSMVGAMSAHVPGARACSGGGPGIEWSATQAHLILLGQVIDAGDAANHAPTFTPIPTPAKPPLFSTPVNTPVSPPLPPRTPPVPVQSIDLVGVRAVFKVEAVYAGDPVAEYVAGGDSRSYLEESLRDWEAGYPVVTGTCGLDDFMPRYTFGGRYLLFVLRQRATSESVATAYRVEGDEIVFNDEGLRRASNGFLALSPETYRLFFAGIPSEGSVITAPSVPLASVLRAVAYLRNDPRIYPPDTGTAGLLPAQPTEN